MRSSKEHQKDTKGLLSISAECLRSQIWHSHEDYPLNSAIWQADTNLKKTFHDSSIMWKSPTIAKVWGLKTKRAGAFSAAQETPENYPMTSQEPYVIAPLHWVNLISRIWRILLLF